MVMLRIIMHNFQMPTPEAEYTDCRPGFELWMLASVLESILSGKLKCALSMPTGWVPQEAKAQEALAYESKTGTGRKHTAQSYHGGSSSDYVE